MPPPRWAAGQRRLAGKGFEHGDSLGAVHGAGRNSDITLLYYFSAQAVVFSVMRSVALLLALCSSLVLSQLARAEVQLLTSIKPLQLIAAAGQYLDRRQRFLQATVGLLRHRVDTLGATRHFVGGDRLLARGVGDVADRSDDLGNFPLDASDFAGNSLRRGQAGGDRRQRAVDADLGKLP